MIDPLKLVAADFPGHTWFIHGALQEILHKNWPDTMKAQAILNRFEEAKKMKNLYAYRQWTGDTFLLIPTKPFSFGLISLEDYCVKGELGVQKISDVEAGMLLALHEHKEA